MLDKYHTWNMSCMILKINSITSNNLAVSMTLSDSEHGL